MLLPLLNCEEYQLLDEELQAQLLFVDGVYLMTRKTARMDIDLYALYHFHVEVFFDKKQEEPLYLKSFDSEQLLDPYLEAISLNAIYNEF